MVLMTTSDTLKDKAVNQQVRSKAQPLKVSARCQQVRSGQGK